MLLFLSPLLSLNFPPHPIAHAFSTIQLFHQAPTILHFLPRCLSNTCVYNFVSYQTVPTRFSLPSNFLLSLLSRTFFRCTYDISLFLQLFPLFLCTRLFSSPQFCLLSRQKSFSVLLLNLLLSCPNRSLKKTSPSYILLNPSLPYFLSLTHPHPFYYFTPTELHIFFFSSGAAVVPSHPQRKWLIAAGVCISQPLKSQADDW